MASEKISEMPVATTLTGAELVPVVQGGTNKQTTTFKVSEIAQPKRISELINDVPLARLLAASPGGKVVIGISPINLDVIDPSGVDVEGYVFFAKVKAAEFKATTTFKSTVYNGRFVLFGESGEITADSDFYLDTDGTLVAEKANFVGPLAACAGGFNVSGVGDVSGNSLHAGNGFNGSGAFTNFTIVDGIITAAS